MIKISIETEDLNNIVNITLKYSEMSLKKRSVIGVNLADRSITLQNEIVQLKFLDVFTIIENKENLKGFSFDVKTISKLKYPTKEIEIKFLKNMVYVKSGKLEVDIRSEYSYEEFYERMVNTLESIQIENKSLLKAVQKVNLPFSFYKGDSNKAPILIRGNENTVQVSASDGFSLCRFSTTGTTTGKFEAQIPRIIFSSFLNKKLEKDGITTIEIQEMAVKIKSGSIILITSQINEIVDDFQGVLDGLNHWDFHAEMEKSELSLALKSISGSMSDKKSVNYIQCKIKPKDNCFDLNYSSSKTGGITYNGIGLNFVSNKIESAQLIINLHAKSFEDFTNLLEKKFDWYGSKKAIYYKESNESGTIEYMFPTINV